MKKTRFRIPKQILSVLLCLAMVLAMLPLMPMTVYADRYYQDDDATKIKITLENIVYTLTEDDGSKKTWTIGDGGWSFYENTLTKTGDGSYKFTYNVALKSGDFDTAYTGTLWTGSRTVTFSGVTCESDYSVTIPQTYSSTNGTYYYEYDLVVTRSGSYGHSYESYSDNGNGTHSRTCVICSHVETLAHDYADATCLEPKTCKHCGATEGEALGHNFADANCTTPEKCTRCGETQGEINSENHASTSFTYEQVSASQHNTLYACCKELYALENHEWNTSGKCKHCGYACEHDSYTDGQCDVCDYHCPHTDMSEGKCQECGMEGSYSYLYRAWNSTTKTLDESYKVAPGEITEMTSETTALTAGWYIVNGTVTTSSTITTTGDVHLILANNAVLNANKGIEISSGTLYIYAQTDDKSQMGKLNANSPSDNDAAIECMNGKYLVINGGNISAVASKYGAGIGGEGIYDKSVKSGVITINGGIIYAKAGSNGAGIGSGYNHATGAGSTGNININGGTINAIGGKGYSYVGAGIGGGNANNGATVVVNGGNIQASGFREIGNGNFGDKSGSIKNSSGTTVSKVTYTLDGVTAETKISEIEGIDGIYYSSADVYTYETNQLYLYLPSASSIASVTIESGQNFGPLEEGETTLYCTHKHTTNGFCDHCNEYLLKSEPAKNEEGIYEIYTLGELIWFKDYVNNGNNSANAIMMKNIDASDAKIIGIGTDTYPYGGTFNGNGYTLTIALVGEGFDSPFKYVNGTTIKNLTVDGTITTSGSYAAGITSRTTGGDVLIENCIIDVDIISSKDEDGTHAGLVGVANSGTLTINNSAFTGSITGENTTNCGGLVGWARATTTINNSYVAGTFNIDISTGTTSNTFSRNPSNATLNNCYYLNELSATPEGATQKTQAQFSSGEVTWLLNDEKETGVWKQTLGEDTYPNFSGKTVYGIPTDCGGKNASGYSNEEQNIIKHVYNSDGLCYGTEGEIHYQPAETDDFGTYQIVTKGNLMWFAEFVNAGNKDVDASLRNDIDLTGLVWTPIGDSTNNFSGVLDGNNKTINIGTQTVTAGYFGIVGYLNGGTVKNLTVEGTVSVDASVEYVSGLVGYATGSATVTGCTSRVNITLTENATGAKNIAGIVGRIAGGPTIEKCANYGTITANGATECIGGITGYANENCKITDCANYANVSSDTAQFVSGILGYVNNANFKGLQNCLNIGTITGRLAVGDIVGCLRNRTADTILNNYYTGTTGFDYYTKDGVTADEYPANTATATKVTDGQLISGEITWLLQNGIESDSITGETALIWGQDIKEDENDADYDAYPVLGGAKVYKNMIGDCPNDPDATVAYANTQEGADSHPDSNSDGYCDVCGKIIDEIGARLVGYSLTLDGNVGVNFYMELDARVIADDTAYMQFTLPNVTEPVQVMVNSVDTSPKEIAGKTYYVFTCKVAAKEMTDTIKAQIFCDDGATKGTEYEYSVREYAVALMDRTGATEEDKALATAMLNYGAYAQTYFNYKTDNLANAEYEMSLDITDTSKLGECVPTVNVTEGAALTYAGSTIRLEAELMVRHYFKLTDDASAPTGLTLYEPKPGTIVDGTYYYYESDGIPFESWGTMTTYNEVDGNSISYCPLSYVTTVVATNSESDLNEQETLQNLMKALYLYYQAVVDYKTAG